jgi:hypothetical protein
MTDNIFLSLPTKNMIFLSTQPHFSITSRLHQIFCQLVLLEFCILQPFGDVFTISIDKLAFVDQRNRRQHTSRLKGLGGGENLQN